MKHDFEFGILTFLNILCILEISHIYATFHFSLKKEKKDITYLFARSTQRTKIEKKLSSLSTLQNTNNHYKSIEH